MKKETKLAFRDFIEMMIVCGGIVLFIYGGACIIRMTGGNW
jgi:hypothetical protein